MEAIGQIISGLGCLLVAAVVLIVILAGSFAWVLLT